jgi:hypothetical protein
MPLLLFLKTLFLYLSKHFFSFSQTISPQKSTLKCPK